ncbi:hypothetical protein PHLGIDRAFT_125061 [Phlebiopsis gigantea 11061_1 CR5-6]|uniref:SPT2 chromatin protein n=1 Tax=Phlebiopsis gigantea (strain 11061_1 CR5-6) TaxID=745531 RepID=A0A0C3SCS2_PHLG1|nr:hypothetical protein PHLGIDRAFT_125061 [Phlebiopsis gigantea 11061_1 CR5-6]
MTSFAALMALSRSQTERSEELVQSQLADRKRREGQKRKELEEKERKEREMEQKMRKRALEEAQRAKEREEKFEAERRAKELALKRKEEEQRNALLYGPKKKAEYPTSSAAAARDDARRRRMPDSDDEGGAALTREEKRKMRLARELNYGAGSSKRTAAGYRKTGRRLAGGAVDVDATASSSNANAGNFRSVKERLTHEPPGLIRLNVNKRDTRTIDEILEDRRKAKPSKVLNGDEAKSFDNWFGKSKPKASSTAPPSPPSSIFSSRSPSPVQPGPSDGSKTASRASKSLSRTPPVVPQSTAYSKSASLGGLSFSKKDNTPATKGSGVVVKSVGGRPADKPSVSSSVVARPANGKMPAKAGAGANKNASSYPAARPSLGASRTAGSSSKLGASVGSFKKRPRSPSMSPSPPPAKRRSIPPGGNSISAEIWKLFGKDRNAYVAKDVYSDDEDMEAGARDLENEELYSTKVARREDELALEQERRHEEEKRRKKKERDMRERRGA